MLRSQWMRVTSCLLALLLLAAAARLIAADPAYQLRVVTDRKDAIYEAGGEAKFLITVSKGDEIVPNAAVKFVVDDFLTSGTAAGFPTGSVTTTEKPGVVAVTGKQPGFLRCQVSFEAPDGKKLQAAAGAGFSPTKIGLSLPVPDDFDAFWAEQKKQLAAVPLEPQLTRADQPGMKDDIECFDVQIKCLGDAPVSGYFARPTNAKPKSLPAILWVHGAGVRSSAAGSAMQGAKHGMLSLDINAHGIPNGKPNEFYQELTNGRLKDYRAIGRESRETSYFRGMFLRLVRAIDFLTLQPEWDGKVVAVIGHSQGGGQALVAGGLDPRVTIIASGVPAICDHSGRAAGRINGWPNLVPPGTDGKPDPRILEASRYVDAVNFASRCQAEAILSVGFIDATCPPSSCYAAFNALRGPKEMLNEPLMNHAAPPHIQDAFLARVLDHVKRQKPLTLIGHAGPVWNVVFSADGNRLASASFDSTVKLWDAMSGQEIMTLKGHSRDIPSVVFSPDGKRLASASTDKTVKVWDAMSGQETRTLKGHSGMVFSVVFSPDGNRLASASEDQTVKVWDVTSGQETLTLKGHTENVSSVAFSQDGKRLASASWDKTVKVWDATSGQETLTLKGHKNQVTSVAFSADRKLLASASVDRTVKVWDVTSGQERFTLKGHTSVVTSIAFSADGKRLASASQDQTVKVWDITSGQETLTLKGHTGAVLSVAISPDGKRLASASLDRTVKVWDMPPR